MRHKSSSKLSVWEKNILGVRFRDSPVLLPGLIAPSVLAWASILASDFIGKQILGFEKSPVSPVMLAIAIGILVKLIFRLPDVVTPGLTCSVKKLLRLGIILLGIRLTVFDIFRLGTFGVPIVAVCIIGALIITTWINSRMQLPERLGTLIAVGTSICGVTAIVAASPAIGADEEESSYAVAVITIFGLFATIVYPYLANFIFAGNASQVGIFLGTSVHETAQVVGAGQIYADVFSQPTALDIATVTKLVRNVFMAFVIPFMALFYSRKAQGGSRKGESTSFIKLFPLFIFGFLFMALVRSIGDAGVNTGGQAFGLIEASEWLQVIGFIKSWAEIFLVIALAAVGLSVDLNSFKELGIKPFLVALWASAAVGGISYLAIKIMGNLVSL